MIIQENSKISTIHGEEGTQIKQIFHPDNTSNQIKYSIAQVTLTKGKKSKLHKLTSSEIYYIIKGQGELKIEDEKIRIKKYDSVYIPPNSKQSIKNIGKTELTFLCIVEPAWKAENEIILE